VQRFPPLLHQPGDAGATFLGTRHITDPGRLPIRSKPANACTIQFPAERDITYDFHRVRSDAFLRRFYPVLGCPDHCDYKQARRNVEGYTSPTANLQVRLKNLGTSRLTSALSETLTRPARSSRAPGARAATLKLDLDLRGFVEAGVRPEPSPSTRTARFKRRLGRTRTWKQAKVKHVGHRHSEAERSIPCKTRQRV